MTSPAGEPGPEACSDDAFREPRPPMNKPPSAPASRRYPASLRPLCPASLVLLCWGLITLTMRPATARQVDAPLQIADVRLVPDSVLHIQYLQSGQPADLDLPVELIAQIVHEYLLQTTPLPAAPPTPLTTGHIKISSPRSGLTYAIQIYVDSLIQIDYEQGGRAYHADLPPEVVTNTSAHYKALAGREVVPDLELFWNDWKFWFRVARQYDLRILLAVLGVLLFAGLFLRSRLKVHYLRAERDELSASRQRMIEAREAERSYLAAELHDGPVQELQQVLRTYLLPLTRRLPPDDSLQSVEAAREALQHVTGELRNLCTELRPPVLVHFGLDKAIRSYVRLFEEREPGIDVSLDLDAEQKTLPLPMRLAFFRICQEALSNVARHARARHVAMTFTLTDAEVMLTIHDDGCGFTPPRRWINLEAEGHLGLSGLAQRAEAIGGVLDITSAPGEGTTLRVVAPRPPEAPDKAEA